MCLGFFFLFLDFSQPDIRWNQPWLAIIIVVTGVLFLVVISGIWKSIKQADKPLKVAIGWLVFVALSFIFSAGIYLANN